MLAFLELTLCNFWKWVDHSLKNVFLLVVAVVVVEDLQDLVGVLRNLIEDMQNKVFMVIDGVPWI